MRASKKVLDIFQQDGIGQHAVRRDLHLWPRHRRAAGARAAAAGSRQAGVRHRHFQGRQLHQGASAVLQGHRAPAVPRAGFRRLRRAGGGASRGAQARHEDHLLVRGCLERRACPTSRRRRRSASTAATPPRCASTIPTTGTGCWARWRTTRAPTRSTASCGARSGRARSRTRSARATAATAAGVGRTTCFCQFCEAKAQGSRHRRGARPRGFQGAGQISCRRHARASVRWTAIT